MSDNTKWDYEVRPEGLGYVLDYKTYFQRGDDYKRDWTPDEVCRELERLCAEVDRQADVLDTCAQEYAHEQTRLESVISDMSNECRELRAEVERLKKRACPRMGYCICMNG